MAFQILADSNIPQVERYFSHLGNITFFDGRHLTSEQLGATDILLVRSITPINSTLLKNSSIKFVGSATIGVDHIDRDYLDQHNIGFANAPGCNANSVADYVLSALCQDEQLLARLLSGEGRLGIVGLGNVGRRVWQRLSALWIDCIAYDPFLNKSDFSILDCLENVLSCDVVSLHTPLTKEGKFPTYHLFNKQVLSKLKPDTWLINAGRGAVIDNHALLQRLTERGDLNVVLDVWENEPTINAELLAKVKIGTPHIAGYSAEGKLAGTTAIYRACCDYFNISPQQSEIDRDELKFLTVSSKNTALDTLRNGVLAVYDVTKDHRDLVRFNASDRIGPHFDALRKNYWQRHEIKHYRINTEKPLNNQAKAYLKAANFLVEPA